MVNHPPPPHFPPKALCPLKKKSPNQMSQKIALGVFFFMLHCTLVINRYFLLGAGQLSLNLAYPNPFWILLAFVVTFVILIMALDPEGVFLHEP